jgi:hypothetical protein
MAQIAVFRSVALARGRRRSAAQAAAATLALTLRAIHHTARRQQRICIVQRSVTHDQTLRLCRHASPLRDRRDTLQSSGTPLIA